MCPSAADDAIFADILRSFGRDEHHVMTLLCELEGFADLDPPLRQRTVAQLRDQRSEALKSLTSVILQCYYRDDRVMRSTWHGAAAAIPQGPRGRTGRLVAAGPGTRTAKVLPRSALRWKRLDCTMRTMSAKSRSELHRRTRLTVDGISAQLSVCGRGQAPKPQSGASKTAGLRSATYRGTIDPPFGRLSASDTSDRSSVDL